MQHPQWKGASPQRFSGGRLHIKPQDELNHLLLSSQVPQYSGLRTFQLSSTSEQQFKPSIRIFPKSYSPEQRQIDLRGKKPLFLPDQTERIRKQKGHVDGGRQTSKEIDFKGIKTYDDANQSREMEYSVQSKMQAKMRVLGLTQQRNLLGVASLGDKSYKYPDYQNGFFKDGGLISGSTAFRVRRGQSIPDPNKLKSVFTKPMWTEKMKMEEKEEEAKVLDSVDQWEKTILKEANPKWNDPETFFQRLEKQAPAGGNAAKDVKKGTKK